MHNPSPRNSAQRTLLATLLVAALVVGVGIPALGISGLSPAAATVAPGDSIVVNVNGVVLSGLGLVCVAGEAPVGSITITRISGCSGSTQTLRISTTAATPAGHYVIEVQEVLEILIVGVTITDFADFDLTVEVEEAPTTTSSTTTTTSPSPSTTSTTTSDPVPGSSTTTTRPLGTESTTSTTTSTPIPTGPTTPTATTLSPVVDQPSTGSTSTTSTTVAGATTTTAPPGETPEGDVPDDGGMMAAAPDQGGTPQAPTLIVGAASLTPTSADGPPVDEGGTAAIARFFSAVLPSPMVRALLSPLILAEILLGAMIDSAGRAAVLTVIVVAYSAWLLRTRWATGRIVVT